MRLSIISRTKRQRGRHKQTSYRSFHVHGAVTHAPLRFDIVFDKLFEIVCLRNAVGHTLNLSSVTSVRMSMVWNLKFWTQSQSTEYSVTWVALSDVIDQNVTWQLTTSRKHSWKHSAFRFIGSDLHKVDKTTLVTINGAVSMLTKAWLKYRTFIVAIAHGTMQKRLVTARKNDSMRQQLRDRRRWVNWIYPLSVCWY